MSECPFCGRDPFHYVDNGLGMEAVAVTCCELGDLFFRGDRPAPEEVTLSWEEFMDVGSRIASANATLADVEMGLQSAQIEHLEVQLASARKALTNIAAECHREKWQFDLSEDYKPTASAARGLIRKSFDELHRIGDLGIAARDETK